MISHTVLEKERALPDYESLVPQERLIRQEPWDVLIVLDACRWDAYKHVYNNCSCVCSVGSSTLDWVEDVWAADDWSDVTYLSANPMTGHVGDRYREDSKHISECVGEYVEVYDEWDSQLGSLHPETLTDAALEYSPPMVVHYIQPHTPFIGDFSFSVSDDGYDVLPDKRDGGPTTRVSRLVDEGLVDRSVVQTAYLSNLEETRADVQRLIRSFSPYDVVVTADHGEAFGPDRWDHGGNCNQGRVVPWDRKT